MSVNSHTFSAIHNSLVCVDCGACSCHTPVLTTLLCADVYSGSHRIYNHDGDITLQEVLNNLRARLNGTDENEAKFIFELRRTALHWCERQWPAKQMNTRQLQTFVLETARFLETGAFSDGKTEEG